MTAHNYPPGWTTDENLPDRWYWVEDVTPPGFRVSDAMTAWRYCPVCGDKLMSPEEVVFSEPRCNGCDRPVDACPCGCVMEHHDRP